FESMEDERRLLVDTRATRRTYLRELQAFLDTWKHGTTDANLTYQLVDTTRPLDRVLSDFLVGQEQRRGGRWCALLGPFFSAAVWAPRLAVVSNVDAPRAAERSGSRRYVLLTARQKAASS